MIVQRQQFAPLGDVSLIAPPSHRDEIIANVRASLDRSLMHLDKAMESLRCDMLGKVAIIGGGPSVCQFVDEIRNFNGSILVCGTAHDWARRNHIGATHYVVGDHHPVICDQLSTANAAAIYFVACQCDQRVFDALSDCFIVLWHCAWPGQEVAFTPEQWAKLSAMQVDGGCTVGLRALSLALMIGYRDVHFYGFDGCLGVAGDEYAYPRGPNPTVDADNDPVTEIRLGRDRPGEKTYRCKGWQVAQANDFLEMFRRAEAFRPTFRGGGLISDLWDEVRSDRDRAAAARGAEMRRRLLGSVVPWR